jgi:hypothetical protein
MSMSRFARVILITIAIWAFAALAFAQGQRIVLGILPVYDSSAENYNENFAPNLTYLLYQELLKIPDVQPVLLSPGGLYEPSGEDWFLEYARRANVDAVLVTRQLPSIRPDERHRLLKFEVQVLDVNTGKRSLKGLNDTVRVSTTDLLTSVVSSSSITNSTFQTYRSFWGNPQEFQKQPLGKAALKLVDWTRAYLFSTLTALQPSRSGLEPPVTSPPCQISFGIRYVAKKTASKAYSIIANDKEESSTIQEGIAQFPMASGPLAVRFQMEDAPYRMPTEHIYQTSTVLDCYSKQHMLVMELGIAGEGFLHWE